MQIGRPFKRRLRAVVRVALSYYVTSGLSAAFGLLLISGTVQLFMGPFAGLAASVGVIVCIPPDQAAPRRGKFWHLLPAAVIGLPLFFAVQSLHAAPIPVGLLLVPATFLAFLGAAWGKRGLPISVSIMLAMVFALAVPAQKSGLPSSLYFALGAGSYLIYATLANAALNARYRVQMLADTLLALGNLMRTQAKQFAPAAPSKEDEAPLIGHMLREQAALADQLQAARDILLESPRTPGRQRLAGMLLHVLELRDHLLACELDLDALTSHPGHAPTSSALRKLLEALAGEIERLADAILFRRQPTFFESLRPELAALQWEENNSAPADAPSLSPGVLARGLASRVGMVNDETLRLFQLARGEVEPDLALVRASWQMFVSPTAWSWRPLLAVWHWDAPPLRHAIRAALAVGAAYALSLALPWGTHDFWILLTIAVVLRGSFAQTLERRNSRVAGTLLGCVLSGALLSANVRPWTLLAVVTLAQAAAHAFAIRRYLVTAVAATLLGLIQAHLLNAGSNPAFDLIERIADTLIGVTIAWAFSYVLPSWERTQIPALLVRTLAAQARHARLALGLGQLQAVDNEPELEWRLARRDVYDSLSALVQATQRSLSEPRAVRPPLEPLGRVLTRSYQLLAQLTAVKTMLLLRRGRLQSEQIREPLRQTAEDIERTLTTSRPAELSGASRSDASTGSGTLPDPFEADLSPWLLRRLDLAEGIAGQLRDDAELVLRPR